MDRLVKWFAVLLLLWFAAGCTEPLIQTDHGTLAASETGTQDRAADKVSDKASVKRFTVRAAKYQFDIQEIRVNQGDPVEITLENMKGYHTLKIEGYNIEVKKNRPVSFVADKKGSFIFRCGVICGSGHEEMTGLLIVE